ncbi:MAG: hypothetical protein GY757_17445 [bacterium]|nr:hypothetical protein [bacterium]
MKQTKSMPKLVLNKTTISRLDSNVLTMVHGGRDLPHNTQNCSVVVTECLNSQCRTNNDPPTA